ncbi:MAG: EcsC family protein [Kineosporiaceae bacterium]|nr:EcsC family protein [Kineosporiaceae bacterium]
MSSYEERRWGELQEHWATKAQRRQALPPKARSALGGAGRQVRAAARKAGEAVSAVTPTPVKEGLERAVDATLVPAVEAAVHLLDLVTDWTTELTDFEKVLEHHRAAGRDVAQLADLRDLDLEQLDDFTRTMALKWRTSGAIQGGAMGALAMVPVAGGVAAVGADMVVMHVLSTALATRVAYSYGFDVKDEAVRHAVDRMARRAYLNQAPKARAVHQANAAFNAAKKRVRRSERLLHDHRILAAVDNLMQQAAHGKAVPIGKVAKGIPVIAVVVGAGTNAYILGDVVHQARLYAQTLRLAEKYELPLPENLRHPHEDA